MSLSKTLQKRVKTTSRPKSTQHQKPHVLIVGGGFAGCTAARSLADIAYVNITLISNKSYFEYYPGFYRIVTGAVPIDVCVPLADVLPKSVDVVIDRIVSVDIETKMVVGDKGETYTADYIILALGSQTSYFNLPGLPEHSFGFKSIAEAMELKKHIRMLFENRKKNCESTEKIRGEEQHALVANFQIVIVGGGSSGVELAGDLSFYMDTLAQQYCVDRSFITIDIVDRGSRLLSTTHPVASDAALTRLRLLGVNVFLNREVMAEDVEKILIGDMQLKTKTVIWTAGTQINSLYNTIPGLTFTERKRVVVGPHLEVAGSTIDSTGSSDSVYVIGDAAGTAFSGLAQTAIYDGDFVAKDINRRIRGRVRKTYTPKPINYIIPIGRNWAIMSLGTKHFFGQFAYFMRQTVDFLYFARILPVRKTIELFIRGKNYN